jgi:hypothetical protein
VRAFRAHVRPAARGKARRVDQASELEPPVEAPGAELFRAQIALEPVAAQAQLERDIHLLQVTHGVDARRVAGSRHR